MAIMTRNALLALVALGIGAGPVAAQTSTATILLPGGSPDMQVMGSILSADGQKTTLVLNCPPSEQTKGCFVPDGGITVTEAPSSVEFHMTNTMTPSLRRTTEPTKSFVEKVDATCINTAGVLSCVETLAASVFFGNGSSTSMTTSTTSTFTGTSTAAVITITAGLDKIGQNGGNSTGTTATAPTNAGPGGGAGPTTALSTSSKPAAGPRVTQQAVLAGVAAVIGGALAL